MAGRTYQPADDALKQRVERVKSTHHRRLIQKVGDDTIAVKIETILVFPPRNKDGVETDVAIKVGGKEAYACIRCTKLEERVAGRGDAVMWIDGSRYKKWKNDILDAIIDHEITHLDWIDHDSGFQLDDICRPRLKLRPHDFEVGWFTEVAERHGMNSVEVLQAARLTSDDWVQLYFPGFDIRSKKPKRTA